MTIKLKKQTHRSANKRCSNQNRAKKFYRGLMFEQGNDTDKLNADIHIYIGSVTDGNPGKGAGGIVMIKKDGMEELHCGGYHQSCSNHYMELLSLHEALLKVKNTNKKVAIFTINQAVVTSMTGKFKTSGLNPELDRLKTDCYRLYQNLSNVNLYWFKRYSFNTRGYFQKAVKAEQDGILMLCKDCAKSALNNQNVEWMEHPISYDKANRINFTIDLVESRFNQN